MLWEGVLRRTDWHQDSDCTRLRQLSTSAEDALQKSKPEQNLPVLGLWAAEPELCTGPIAPPLSARASGCRLPGCGSTCPPKLAAGCVRLLAGPAGMLGEGCMPLWPNSCRYSPGSRKAPSMMQDLPSLMH